MNKFICIHGHFYQPPRENPFRDDILIEPSASPYQNWNERITAECYQPNAKAKILENNGGPAKVINNYSKISFNFGPTLLSWMQKHAQETYQAVLDADKMSLKLFNGHGSAIAQCYNHMIMPLANARDKRTQIIWGIKDFEYRFKRRSEGMWLPETAVDEETLELLAEQGIKYTILAPNQALRVKKFDEKKWHKVSEDTIYTQIPYLCRLPSGREMTIFFYDGRIANEVAFGELLENGEHFAHRMLREFDEQSEEPRLVHIATDGETYGHHHKFGEMALAYCIEYFEKSNLAQITNYGNYLEQNPPTHEVQIKPNSSWSCSHGIERWRSDCGCSLDGHALWNQKWRRNVREALDWLRDRLGSIYEQKMNELGYDDPWAVRDQYVDSILSGKNNYDDVVHNLLEIQHNAMLMYTSCGWFFDDVSGIETRQILKYAAYAIELTKTICDEDLEDRFKSLLKSAKSNVSDLENGKLIYEQFVKEKGWIDKRSSGVLLHISSLPSSFGIGDLGQSAYEFVDFLYHSKQSFWQILPLNPTDAISEHSPYSSSSAFAANILFISPEMLIKERLLDEKDIIDVPSFSDNQVNYKKVVEYKQKILQLAYQQFQEKKIYKKEFRNFVNEHRWWLEDYALFTVIKKIQKGKIWTEWPQDLRNRKREALRKVSAQFEDDLKKIYFFQFLFFIQWNQLRTYAHSKGIHLIGDIPYYVHLDSVDVWCYPKNFKLDKDGCPTVVAGVPPDYFSQEGQRWGNPVYDWNQLKKTQYDWWIRRFQLNLKFFDAVRIDHFRGFINYWEIPTYERTALNGQWQYPPCDDFFKSLRKHFKKLPIIAEDLGMITPEVREQIRQLGFPGMKILLFAFDSGSFEHPYLPHNYNHNCVVYTGTHDNNTTRGWFQNEATQQEKENVFRYMKVEPSKEQIHNDFIKLAMESPADLAIIPMQDVLGLGEDARMNKPATTNGNWLWRLSKKKINKNTAQNLSYMTELSKRSQL